MTHGQCPLAAAQRIAWVGAALLMLGAWGCQGPGTLQLQPPTPASDPARTAVKDPPTKTDAPQTERLTSGADPRWGPAAHGGRLDVVLTVLCVKIPQRARQQAAPLWNHLSEDVLASDTLARLAQNGLRVGVGHAEWWDAVKSVLDATPGTRSLPLDPVRVPPKYPLALELDRQAREQTLFFVSDDGILTGETWPQSRNVLRVSYELDLAAADRVKVTVVPEVRQRLEGFRWVRSEAGLSQTPDYNGRAYNAAGFQVELTTGEFLLVCPSEQAALFGILGGAFLSAEEDGERYDSYVFLRADVNHVAHRN
jgi:hypothetical protein